jgi:hypothetical protein
VLVSSRQRGAKQSKAVAGVRVSRQQLHRKIIGGVTHTGGAAVVVALAN